MQTTTFQNVATSDSYGADVNGSLRLGALTGFGGVSLFQQVTDGSNLSTDVSNNAFGWSARTNATLKLTPTLDVQGFVDAVRSTGYDGIWGVEILSADYRKRPIEEAVPDAFRTTMQFLQ